MPGFVAALPGAAGGCAFDWGADLSWLPDGELAPEVGALLSAAGAAPG